MTTPEDYNRARLGLENLADHEATIITELVRIAQAHLGLEVDGKFGPKTRAAVEASAAARGKPGSDDPYPIPPPPPPPFLDVGPTGWLRTGGKPVAETDDKRITWYVDGNVSIPTRGPAKIGIDPSWYYAKLYSEKPRAIVAHYTTTGPGTARNMARNRLRPHDAKGTLTPKDPSDDRAASWHITIDTDGSVVQMAPLTAGCWHAGGATCKAIPGIGAPNRYAVGIEIVSRDGSSFTAAQVAAARRVWRAIVAWSGMKREHAMIAHSALDPYRRSDPGPVWMGEHAPGILDFAFGGP